MDVSSVVSFPQKVLLVDATSNFHPFFTHRLDAGPIRLTTIIIAHAFNYRVAVLRDGVSRQHVSAIFVERKGEFWRIRMFRGVIKLLSCFRWCLRLSWMCLHFSRTLMYDSRTLMYNYPANHGDIWTIVLGVVNVSPQIERALMFTGCPSCPRRVYLYRNWRTYQSLPGEVVRG